MSAQGGSDVRANTTRATPVDASKAGAYPGVPMCEYSEYPMCEYSEYGSGAAAAVDASKAGARMQPTMFSLSHRCTHIIRVLGAPPLASTRSTSVCEYSEYPSCLHHAGPGDEFTLVGHKWFTSAPMSDAFLTLAHVSTP